MFFNCEQIFSATFYGHEPCSHDVILWLYATNKDDIKKLHVPENSL